MTEPYDLYAIRYACHPERRAADNFIGGDEHDGPMPMDFFVWAAVSPTRTVVIDTGFSAETARRRQRQHLRCPGDGLRLLGIDPAKVADVVVTHMHYDHIGNFNLFPAATFHLQEREMAYATGRHMCHGRLRAAFEVEDVVGMVRRLYEGRVRFHDGTAELAPGLTLHRVGGHTDGLQIVRVWTRRGWVVVASDASHYYANMEEGRPFPIVLNVGDMLDGHRTAYALADGPQHVVPGHDPLVMRRYPPPRPDLDGIAVRLDVAPAED